MRSAATGRRGASPGWLPLSCAKASGGDASNPVIINKQAEIVRRISDPPFIDFWCQQATL
jgi:hypothetical protein